MYIRQYFLLDDAYFFLNQAKSLSDTPTAQQAKQRQLRASVLFCWQGLEYLVKEALGTRSKFSLPRKFSTRLELALMERGLPFDVGLYHKFYRMRNDVIHVNTGAKQPGVSDVEELFAYCKNMHLKLMPEGHKLRITTNPF